LSSTHKFSGKQVSRSGELLLEPDIAIKRPDDFDMAMDALSYWRSCHEAPLERAHDLLREAISKIDRRAVSARRLKRIQSIIRKLKRFQGMKLRAMQDIGGCRAILKNQKSVTKAVRELKKRKSLRVKDYIKLPKEDGYRGIHLIGDFSGKNEEKRSIEIQLRTKIQHSWATAVEIIDLFTGQAIKSSYGDEDWKRFFRLISGVLAHLEDIPNFDNMSVLQGVNAFVTSLNTLADGSEYKQIINNLEEVYLLTDKLSIKDNFRAFAASLKITEDHCEKDSVDGYVIMEIDIKRENLTINTFPQTAFNKAAAYYLSAEKQQAIHPEKVVVLVSTDAVGGLKEAYPNYFADSAMFLKLLSVITAVYKIHNPNKVSRALKRIFK
jgi:ppGpp synthetase/RelA/SpoT-type nucleotidyltranferase